MSNQVWWSAVQKTLRPKILLRDNYTCQRCGLHYPRAGRYLYIHHVDNDGTNNVEKNLIVICISCHRKISKRTEIK